MGLAVVRDTTEINVGNRLKVGKRIITDNMLFKIQAEIKIDHECKCALNELMLANQLEKLSTRDSDASNFENFDYLIIRCR